MLAVLCWICCFLVSLLWPVGFVLVSIYLLGKGLWYAICSFGKAYCYTPGKSCCGISFVRGGDQGQNQGSQGKQRKPLADEEIALGEITKQPVQQPPPAYISPTTAAQLPLPPSYPGH